MLLIKNRFVIFSTGVVTGLIIKNLLEQYSPKECPFDPESPLLCGRIPDDQELASESETDTENRLDDITSKN